ncbi:bifunctional aminoglycoside phosphotransferase/ATP-binding protein [Hydrogenophaga pseudoflava]|uniref:bifunctional aminoglycoside phosphotransferase/ATP-binding protein n=1 Tax=Hydrogenophaga pseudoflava TaxID=47421 RepID=UPI0027E50D19|nr:AAA family ATPase [Hydrogenophaga pseudoflava]MDQ7743364.1 AAA family ATPase [Hydrogenophaga pseudoflava]
MSEPVPPLIAALMQPARYPHPVDRVELVQTHGAWVLLAGDFAYKIKKPVRFPFMDFGTLGARRHACETEIRVNRRFQQHDRPATHLYLGVWPIVGTAENPRWGEAGDGQPAIEYAVQMRRFDETARLDHVCRRGELTAEHVAGLARRMAAFQARAAAAGKSQPWGHATAAMRWPRDNFNTLRTQLKAPADAALVQALSDWTEQRFVAIEPLLSRRRQKERVREGHGDLHLANLALIDGEVLPFDAIEFNDELRWIDVASDMAFCWMDLLDHGQPGLANVLLSEWLDASGDVSAPTVWSFFASYRAGVRAKVAAIRAGQLTGSPEADQHLAEARRYLALAQDIAHPPSPQLVITHGLSGSGKTWASGRWLQTEASGRAVRLRSDVERKRLHGMSPLAASGSGLHEGLYRPQAHEETYASLRARARMLLQDGWSVVVDAAFLREAERRSFAELAEAEACPFHILACEAPADELRRRISARQAAGRDASEATLAVLEQQFGWLEPLGDAERARGLTA